MHATNPHSRLHLALATVLAELAPATTYIHSASSGGIRRHPRRIPRNLWSSISPQLDPSLPAGKHGVHMDVGWVKRLGGRVLKLDSGGHRDCDSLVGRGFGCARRTMRVCFACCRRRGVAPSTNASEKLDALQYLETTKLRVLQDPNSDSQYLHSIILVTILIESAGNGGT